MEVLVDLVAARKVRRRRAKADGGKDRRRVETEAVEGNVEGEPRVRRTDEELEILPLREVCNEVAAGGLRRLSTLNNRVGVDVVAASSEEVLDVLGRLLDVAFDVHGETGRLGDGETEVESDGTRNAAKTDEDAPHLVYFRVNRRVLGKNGVLVCGNDDEANQCGS